jgi:hypothetical protein
MRSKNFKVIFFILIFFLSFEVRSEIRTVRLASQLEIKIDIPAAYQNHLPTGTATLDDLTSKSNIYYWVKNPEFDSHILIYSYPKTSTNEDENSFLMGRKSLLLNAMDPDRLEFSGFKELKINGLKAWQTDVSGIYKSAKAKGLMLLTNWTETVYSAPDQFIILRERSGTKPEVYAALKSDFLKIANSLSLVSARPSGINESKLKCSDLGFKDGTEGFGKCVLRLSK